MNTGQELVGDNLKSARSEDRWLAYRSQIEGVFGLLAFAAAYYVSYSLGMAFSPTVSSPFWFPDSVLLCALLVTRPSRWWIFLLASLPIRLFSPAAHDVPLWLLLSSYLLDSAKGVVGALALRRSLPNPTRLETLKEFAIFGAIAVVSVPAVAAFAGAAVRSGLGDPYWTAWVQWFLGDALAQLVITPAILALGINGLKSVRMLSRARRIEATVLIIVLIATGYLAVAGGTTSA